MAKPIFPWPGGKRKLAKHILPLLGEHTCYVEPFAGAAAIFFAKEPSKVEVLNDLNGDLANLYRVVKHHFGELYSQFKWVLISRENWNKIRSVPPESLTDIQRAARFLYVQKMAFGAKVEGPTFGIARTAAPRFNLLSLERDLEDAHLRLTRTYIEQLDWKRLINKYDSESTVFYCDPPYWETEGYGIEFGWQEYEALAELSHTLKGRMVLSINSHPEIRKLFSGIPLKEVDYRYTIGGADEANSKPVKELIYWTEAG
ncbi:DNA adenine methylase [Oceanobacter mangrovi]|uniref:DNA adenine methylase n=1 Tax=Oceanobacter mangrovi TaxID=2862510 RepID=UPI001C8E14DD|nr:DNA adenine methylase [Oceanobacter mangrovi]